MSADEEGFDVDSGDYGNYDNSGPLISWYDIGNIPKPLRKFIVAPVSFILGALLSVLLDGIEDIVESFIKAILAIFDAIAVIPETAEWVLTTVFGAAGSDIISALDGLFLALETAASAAGPFAPILAGGALAMVIVGGAYAAQFAWTLLVDSINPL